FDLDVSGIAGFFGGDESIAAMASVNLIRYRWLLGWYNSPGNYFVSKRYGIIAGNRVWDGLFPGKNSSPATILGLDGQHGPKFLGSRMGTSIEMTGHLSHLLFSHRKDYDSFDPRVIQPSVPQSSSPFPSTTVSLSTVDPAEARYMYGPMRMIGFIGAFLTIGFSVGAAVVAALVWHDYFCCIAICIGILCNGIAGLVYGSATLQLFMPFVPRNSVAGDGIFVRENDIVIVRGPESKIGTIKRGSYELVYPEKPPYHRIGFISIALAFQTFSQIILLPEATLKGQVIFLATFALSWLYNAYLASVDREKLQFRALRKVLGLSKPKTKNFLMWASAVIATTFLLNPSSPDDWIRQLIPNNVPTWIKWRECVIRAME
ncbi:hypothetical protein BDN70DRAFT_763110, partial [Pholiota conissans]